ncbi:hypothetical protein CIT31_21335 [Mesorhizobium wenxiniae]|jgi:hypothetical protein|uniref:Uncharacterized protein n=1 Tax=Mesorhizobium wenxiniae TaxID=2014805 RepID=A0A271KCP9_9HYPH|nr:hypothetical protein CIT31_21335 [Mesorhizobium wenxiniae]
MASGILNTLAVLRAGAKKQKERTRASLRAKQSLFRKHQRQEKKIPQPRVERIQAAVASLDLWRF